MGISVRSFDASVFAWVKDFTAQSSKLEVEEQGRRIVVG